ncbi:tetratricopeptide repeat protein 29 [Synchiropus splendidus]|uniref:tetratricopeptide repeat protein 29 n=1 Tax=Synchiropus splendidus TaxID=270530 RepID=UPI00237DF6F2|nr:tetratricopeptide repeat protein 29 [Synchiropus splendidus]
MALMSTQILSQKEIARFRNRLKHTMSVEMLQNGYHRSFSEFLFLLNRDHSRRMEAPPNSLISLQTPLEEDMGKLEAMKLHLTQAEEAERTGSWSSVYQERLLLAQYFSAPEDLWLRLHFFLSCTDKEQGLHSRPSVEARVCLAEIYSQQGDLDQAREHAELCLLLSGSEDMLDSSGQPLRLRVCQVLWRIYSQLADSLQGTTNFSEVLKMLHRGYVMTAECEDKHLEAHAAYQLGLTHHAAGNYGEARKFLTISVRIYDMFMDSDGLGKTYKAMAKLLANEGNIEETIQCLEKLVDVSGRKGLEQNLADACMSLGNIYLTWNELDKAAEYFQQGYESACGAGDVSLLQRAQVSLACARGHSLIKKYAADVVSGTPAAIQRLLRWKKSQECGASWRSADD